MKDFWFTSDHHFGHEKIIEYCNRPFSSVEEMDEIMVEKWNKCVKPKDVVYHLGDFTLGNDYKKYYDRLNGKIFFIPGNHDHRWIKEFKGDRSVILPPLYTLEIRDDFLNLFILVLCHYSLRVWDRLRYVTFHLFGHSHGNLAGIKNSMDVGVDTNNFYPYNLYDIVKELTKEI